MAAKKSFSRFIVFPITYLILELIEELLIYKAESIVNPWLKTLAVIGILIFVISVVAFALVPFVQGGLESLRKSDKRHGPIGEMVFTLFLVAFIYALYYFKTVDGGNIEALLPKFLLN